MNRNIFYVGLDVDDTQYHGSAVDKTTGEIINFKCRPTLKGLLGQLNKLGKHFPGYSFRICYEASYIGYILQRDIVEAGYPCEVVAPTSIPSPRGRQIKTDRIDASQLAQFYANGLLSIVNVPEQEQEHDRDWLAYAPVSVAPADGTAQAYASVIAPRRVALQGRHPK